MRIVPLVAAPNQSFTVTLDGVRWGLRLVAISGAMACDVSRDGVPILLGVRVVAGEPIIPYRYLQTGNFLFLTDADTLPGYLLFGISQVLVYLTAAEIAAVPTYTAGEAEAASAQVGYIFTDDGFYITTDTGDLIEDA